MYVTVFLSEMPIIPVHNAQKIARAEYQAMEGTSQEALRELVEIMVKDAMGKWSSPADQVPMSTQPQASQTSALKPEPPQDGG